MKLNLYSIKGNKLDKEITLDESVFQSDISEYLVTLSVYVHMANQRQSNAHTKTRGEVRGGGAKPWQQKGTGRARAGSIRSPIWAGGGVVFGPRKKRNYKKRMTRSMKRKAMRSVLSTFAKQEKILGLEGKDIGGDKLTKQVVDLIEKLPVEGKVLVVQTGDKERFFLGTRNLKKVKMTRVNELNVYEILKYDYVLFFEDAITEVCNLWAVKESKKGKVKENKDESKPAEEKSVKSTNKEKQNKPEKGETERKVKDLGLSSRIETALEKADIKKESTLREKVENEEKIDGIGKKSLSEIKEVLNL